MAISPASLVNKTVTQPLHLKFLEGLRGLSAMYVVLFHLYGNNLSPSSTPWIRFITGWTHWGGYAVDVFIVLSGYCLMIPVACSMNGDLRGGFVGYIKRRARRILPPYYAALFIALLLYLLIPIVFPASAVRIRSAYSLTTADFLSHLFLIHNVNAPYARTIDPPMWSVATEWQIYFLFPLILLPIWRRFGNIAVIIIGFFIGMLPIWLSHGRWFWWASPWFVGLFAMGMVGAVIQFNGDARLTTWRKKVPWGWLSLCLFFFVCLLSIALPSQVKQLLYVMDALVAFTTFSFIAYCATAVTAETKKLSVALQILESPLAIRLGAFSYSLYLVHFIVMMYVCDPFSSFLSSVTPLTDPLGFLFDATFKLFTIIAFSYLFYIFFEKPFVSRKV